MDSFDSEESPRRNPTLFETNPTPESIEGVLYMLRDRQTAAAPIGHRLSLRTPAIRIQVSFPFLVAYPVL